MNDDMDQAADRGKPAHLDLVAALALFAIGAISISQMGSSIPDWVFPRSLTYLLLGVGALLAGRGLLKVARQGGLGRLTGAPGMGHRVLDVAVFCVITVAYVILENGAGFWVTSFVMLVGTSLYLTMRTSLRSVAVAVVAATVTCVLAYLVFLQLFYVPLPPGSWW